MIFKRNKVKIFFLCATIFAATLASTISGAKAKNIALAVEIKAISKSENKELNEVLKKVVDSVKNKTDYEKVVYFHDYIVQNSFYQPSDRPTNAYDVLISGKAQSDGYADALEKLVTLAGIENKIVDSKTKTNSSPEGAHFFNKVLIEKKWYNVDVAVDDPPTNEDIIKRTYLLVTDDVVAQRYTWDTSKYPKANTKNNWHMRNNLAAKTQKDFEKLIKKAIDEKQTSISIWIEDFNLQKYDFSFIKKISSIKDYSISYIATDGEQKTKDISTAVVVKLTYK